MLAFRILIHALRQALGNLRAALILSVLPFVTVVAGGILWWTAMRAIRGMEDVTAPAIAVHLGYLLLVALSFVSLATAWHRFVLLEEPPRLWRGLGRVQGVYVLTNLKIWLIALLIGLLAYLPSIVLMALFEGGSTVRALYMALMSLLMTAVILRLATALAGTATGAPDPVTTAWHATRSRWGTLLLLALFSGLLQYAISLPLLLPGIAGVALAPVVYWFGTIMSLSLITTLWGHFVEGRALR